MHPASPDGRARPERQRVLGLVVVDLVGRRHGHPTGIHARGDGPRQPSLARARALLADQLMG